MLELLLVHFWILAWFFEAKSDLQYKVAEKVWDTYFIFTAILIQMFTFLTYISWCKVIWLTVIALTIHFVAHDVFINLWRGRKPFAHFTVDNKDDWMDKIHSWFYKKGLNLSIIATVIWIFLDSAYIFAKVL